MSAALVHLALTNVGIAEIADIYFLEAFTTGGSAIVDPAAAVTD